MDETFDFVVIGSGGGGLCAALVMRSLGKSVVVLEKTAQVGGATAMSGGVMWVPDNRFMKEAGVPDSREQAMAYMDAVVGDDAATPGADRARRMAYIEQAPRMVDFLVDQGVPLRRLKFWPDYYSDAPGASAPGRTVVAKLYDINRLGDWTSRVRPGFLPLPANLEEAAMLPRLKRSWAAKRALARILLRGLGARLRGRRLVTAGSALVGWTLEAALRAGVDLRTGAPVGEIVMDGDRVAGVVVGGDAPRRIAARSGVLIASGGFARDADMIAANASHGSVDWTLAPEGDTGEILTEGMRIGGAVAQMDVRVFSPMAFPPDGAGGVKRAGVQNDAAKPHCIVVDQSGRRYMSEAASYMDFCYAMMARDAVSPAVPSWLVMDSRYVSRYMLAGSMAGAKKPQAWFDTGFLRKGATVAELADVCGMDAAALAASIERFNGFARAGHDEDFRRGERVYERWLGDPDQAGSATLGTLEEAPFYAIQVFPGNVGTFGGLVTDTRARVLRPDGTPIEGLYATGTATASVMGRTSPGAGSSIGPTYTWGYVAAKHAANADNLVPAAVRTTH